MAQITATPFSKLFDFLLRGRSALHALCTFDELHAANIETADWRLRLQFYMARMLKRPDMENQTRYGHVEKVRPHHPRTSAWFPTNRQNTCHLLPPANVLLHIADLLSPLAGTAVLFCSCSA